MTAEVDLLAILTAPEPTPAPVVVTPKKRTKRHFYRCNDCLSVVATEAKIAEVRNPDTWRMELKATCDACEGRMEYMGETVSMFNTGWLSKQTGVQPACDGKCIGATGPNCDCKCGGENHGSGKVVPVFEQFGIPRLQVPKEAGAKADAYRALLNEFRELYAAKIKPLQDRRIQGDWLEAGQFARLTAGQRLHQGFIMAKHGRTHASRNKKLAALIAELRST